MAGSDDGVADIVSAGGAVGDDATVSIAVDFMAGRRPSDFEDLVEGECGGLAAAVLLASGVEAELAALGRINTVEPYPLTMNFDGVAIDDRGDANNRPGEGRGCSK